MAWAELLVFLALASTAQSKRPHVLFLVADDLRPWLRAYGDGDAHSPNIDALARRSLL
eukprot:COSAG01_NODE_40848_length_458_cov_1796.885794_1_plen_57_part_10